MTIAPGGPTHPFEFLDQATGEPLAIDDEMAGHLRAVDWSATPLGLPEQWPTSLHTALRTMLASRFSMWMAWGPDLTFFCNQAYRRDTLGVKYPWAIGRPAREVWAEVWADIEERIEGVLQRGDSTWDEALFLILERSGYAEESYHTFSYSPLAGDDGRIAGMLCVVSEETERVIAERRMAALRPAEADGSMALSEAEVVAGVVDQLTSAAHDLPFGLIYLLDDDGGATLAGASGVTPGEPVAPRRIGPDESDPAWALSRGAHLVTDLEGRFTVLPRGPWPDPPSCAAVVPLADAQQRVLGYLIAGLNPRRPWDAGLQGFLELLTGQATARLAAARDYAQQRARAEALAELDRAKTAFFTNVSHEFRTPLTLLLGPLDDALRDVTSPLPAAQRERLELADRNAQRLLRLVNSLLDFSRLTAGTAQMRREPLDLSALTTELASTFAGAMGRAGLSLVIACPPLTRPVEVDRDLWSTLVLNLLSNALKFTFEGGVTVTLTEEGDEAILIVADTGIGVEPAEVERLFERFHRVVGARSRTHEGSGIGLALVAELAAAHGGTVSAASDPGAGTAFTVRVPIGSTAPATDAAVVPDLRPTVERHAPGFVAEALRWIDTGTVEGGPAPEAHPASSAGRPLILVAEDSFDMRRYLTGLLAKDYDVVGAADGVEALARVAERAPDLVLTDVMMPNLDGLGLLAALRADPLTADLPIVMLSARGGEEATVEGLDAGADDYLVKPFSARELLARVRANLELDRVMRRRDELQRRQAILDQAEHLAHVGSWEVGVDRRGVSASAELLRMLDVVDGALDQLSPATAVQRFIHPDDRAAVAAALDGLLVGGRPFSLEARIVSELGTHRLVLLRAEAVLGADGAVVAVRGIAQDLTERRRAEEALAAAAAARTVAAREHRIAEELQASLLPARTFAPDHLEVDTFYRAGAAGTRVGGDWYDVIELGAGRTALVVGDVMGSGVHAAAVMGQLRAAVRAYARLDLLPSELLSLLDEAVREMGDEQIVTCVYAVYDPFNQSLCYANAGHPPPLLLGRSGVAATMDAVASPLGTGPLSVTDREVQLPPGSVACLYTDGLVERRGQDVHHGVDRLRAILEGLVAAAKAGDGHLGAFAASIAAALLPADVADDVAILVARSLDANQPMIAHLDVAPERSAVAEARRWVRSTLRSWRAPDEIIDDIVLAVDELAANAVIHGASPVELWMRRSAQRIFVEVLDGARTLPRANLPGPDDEHGRGLQMVAVLADRWGARPTSRGKAVWCNFTL